MDEYLAHRAFFEELLERVQPRDCTENEKDAWINALEDALDNWR